MTDLPSTPREALEVAAQCVEASRLAGGRSSLEAFKATKKEIAAVIRAIPVAEPVLDGGMSCEVVEQAEWLWSPRRPRPSKEQPR